MLQLSEHLINEDFLLTVEYSWADLWNCGVGIEGITSLGWIEKNLEEAVNQQESPLICQSHIDT